TDDELRQAEKLMETLTWDPGRRRTRRWTPGHGRVLDLPRIVRRNVRYGGEPLALPRRERRSKPRPLVLIADVSGSMERYARMLLHFAHSLVRGRECVETFVFATRLTRITHELRRARAADTVPKVPHLVPDWSGGTRIGHALHSFNATWTRRV